MFLCLLAAVFLSSEHISVFIADFCHGKAQFESNCSISQSKLEESYSFKWEQILKIWEVNFFFFLFFFLLVFLVLCEWNSDSVSDSEQAISWFQFAS